MKSFTVYFCLLFVSLNRVDSKDQFFLNGSPFPPSIFIPLDRSFPLECQSTVDVHWKIYLKTGKIEIIDDRLVRLNQFDDQRDGFYQCCSDDRLVSCSNLFVFSFAARAIDRHWTKLNEFQPNLLAVCQPIFFNFGFNEQLIELIDSEQIVRYNRSALLVKHIRSTTHLYCKIHIDTTIVGVRVQTLIPKQNQSALLSDQLSTKNQYINFGTIEQDLYRVAFEGDSIYFHCIAKQTANIQWKFLAWNNYSLKRLDIIYETDAKFSSVNIDHAGIYACHVNETITKRIVLTILHPPKSTNGIYEQTFDVRWNSKHLICCHLDAIPYPSYTWSMQTNDDHQSSFIWCKKRCCWLTIINRVYQPTVCTSKNQFGLAKYTVRLNVEDYDTHGNGTSDQTNPHKHQQNGE